MSHQFLKLSGILSVIGGLSLGFYQLLHPGRDAHSVLNSPYSLIHDMGLLSIALLLFGIIGIYSTIEQKIGRYGFINFVLIFFGTVLEAGVLWVDAYLNPAMATIAPDFQTASHGSGVVHHVLGIYGFSIALFPITWLMFIIGHVWFARNLKSSGSYPKLAAILIMLGAPLFGGQLLVPLWVETLGGLLLGLGYAWVGYALLKTRIPV